ncbi:UNVERIFIED_ORG: hypothetical protein M2193_004605 [Bradyrhizobium japonicum]|uniref:AAA family ATPase n=1 Tax=Bradyrhizobium diazoefficiens TaxID=1355477 RepID=UPI003482BFB1
MSRSVRPRGYRDAVGGPMLGLTVALSEALLARGRAVLVDGALPTRADALCMLGPPFGDAAGAVARLSRRWPTRPLVTSYDGREALDDVSADEDDLIRLRDVLGHDFALAPSTSRAAIGQTVMELDLALAWTGGGLGGARLAGLSACHSGRCHEADERLLAAAAALAYAAAGARRQGLPVYGRWGAAAVAPGSDAVAALVADTRAVLHVFADLNRALRASATVSAEDPSGRVDAAAREAADLLRTVPDRLPFLDSDALAGFASFAALTCPGRAAGRPPESARCEDLRRDCAAWAAHLLTTRADALPADGDLTLLLADMAAGRRFSAAAMVETIRKLETLAPPDDGEEPSATHPSEIVPAVRLRLNLYAAHLGDPTAAAVVASWSAGFAVQRIGGAAFWPMAVASLAWAERSCIAHPAAISADPASRPPEVDDVLNEAVASRLDRVASGLAHALAAVAVERDDGAAGEATRSFDGLWRRSVATPPDARRAATLRAAAAAAEAGTEAGNSVVVVRSMAEGKTVAAREMRAEFEGMLGEPVPLVFTRDVRGAYRRLVAEAPHARAIIDVVLRDTAGSRTAAWRPTLLVGKPGSGKTRLCLRICQELAVPHRVFACGGVSDASFGGTSRQWSTGRASVPLQTIRQHRVANPAIVLDEIDKVGRSRLNGNLVDGLLSMLEPLNSSNLFDVFLEGEVDLHRVLWLATANDADALHPALLDRFRILEMPDPEPDHLLAVLPGVTSAVVGRRGLSPEWVAPFEAAELGIIAELWPGGSIRRLARVVEAILDARDDPRRAN